MNLDFPFLKISPGQRARLFVAAPELVRVCDFRVAPHASRDFSMTFLRIGIEVILQCVGAAVSLAPACEDSGQDLFADARSRGLLLHAGQCAELEVVNIATDPRVFVGWIVVDKKGVAG